MINPTDENKELANNLIDLIEDAVKDLDKFSAYNDDSFNSQVDKFYELVKEARRQV